jgi:hypothetical protein
VWDQALLAPPINRIFPSKPIRLSRSNIPKKIMTSEGEEAIWACLKPLPIIEEERDRNVRTLENIVNIIKTPLDASN